MGKKIITSGAIEIEKHRLHHPKSLILLEDIDTEKSKRVNNLYSAWYTHTDWWNTWRYSISFANNFVVLKKWKKNQLSNTPAFKIEYKSVYISFISQVFCWDSWW